MYPADGLGLVLLVVIGVWLGTLTFYVFRISGFLQKLFPKRGIGSLQDRLTEVLEEVSRLEDFKKESLKDISKVSVMRFNPYKDTGGDQSFSLALLNSLNDGVVITSLHSRSGTRVFAKGVKNGKEESHEFSEEEKEVVKKAMG